MHLHLGNIDFNKKFLVNSYILAYYLQKEIFETLPRSRRRNEYCRELPNLKFRVSTGNTVEDKIALEEDYNALFKFISADKIEHPNFEYNKSRQHPLGAKCGYNHNTPRYCWINYVPAMFDTRGNKSHSIEIRNHSGTTNFVKIKNWLLFFMGFMAFVERHPEKIIKGITMKDVIDTVLPKKSKSLNFYFESRKKLFAEDSAEQSEYANTNSNEEFKNIKDLIIE